MSYANPTKPILSELAMGRSARACRSEKKAVETETSTNMTAESRNEYYVARVKKVWIEIGRHEASAADR
jgi:hypothetical protein